MKARGALATVLALIGLGLAAIALVFVAANGATSSWFALCATIGVCALLAFALVHDGARRRLLACAAALACVVLGYITSRLARAPSHHTGLRYCASVRCDAQPPFAATLVDEDETARFGLALSSHLGLIGDDESAALERALADAYERHRTDERFTGLPNAIFIGVSGDDARHLVWTPDGDESVPCLVFLHGFGGQLSVYVEALIAGGLDDVVIVAPFADRRGTWSSMDERRVLTTLIDERLPRNADRSRVFLVGLSNGAVATTHLLDDANMRARLAGAVLISGSDVPTADAFDRFPVLVITGDRDPRFPRAFVAEDTEALSSRGAHVTLDVLSGDHFIVLDRYREVASRIEAFIAEAR